MPKGKQKNRSGNHNPKWTYEQLVKARAALVAKQQAKIHQENLDKIYKRREFEHRAKLAFVIAADKTTHRMSGVRRNLDRVAYLDVEDLRAALEPAELKNYRVVAIATGHGSYFGPVRSDRLVAKRLAEIEACRGTTRTSSIYDGIIPLRRRGTGNGIR